MKRTAWVILVFLILFAGTTFAENLNGTATWWYIEWCQFCYYYNGPVKICLAGGDGRPSNQCYTANVSAGSFSFSGIPPGTYFVYLWSDGDPYYGSATYPHYKLSVASFPAPTTYWTNMVVYPRTYPPRAVYPADGAHDVPAPAITLEWTAGIDTPDRNHPSWPLAYDIYASGNEFPELKVLSDVPCPTAWTTNKCSIPIPNLQYETRYQWRVVSKLKSGPLQTDAGLDNSYTQTSQTFRFSTTWNPSSPPLTIRTANNNYFKAPNGGGGSLSATGTANTWETQFKLQDHNGGTLNPGDHVCIYTNRSYYLTALEGYGTVTANQQSCGPYETWAYEPVSGGVAFRHTWQGYYMSATNGGGSTITATAVTVGPNETFQLQ